MGLKAQDTCELFFEDVKLPAEALLGEVDQGFYYLMNELPQARDCPDPQRDPSGLSEMTILACMRTARWQYSALLPMLITPTAALLRLRSACCLPLAAYYSLAH